jgi:hypothetical protein
MMTEVLDRVSFEEFSENLVRFFERVVHEHETLLIESPAGELVELKPVTAAKGRRRAKTEADYEAFLGSLGGWKDVDVDAFLKDNEESRRISREADCPDARAASAHRPNHP